MACPAWPLTAHVPAGSRHTGCQLGYRSVLLSLDRAVIKSRTGEAMSQSLDANFALLEPDVPSSSSSRPVVVSRRQQAARQQRRQPP